MLPFSAVPIIFEAIEGGLREDRRFTCEGGDVSGVPTCDAWLSVRRCLLFLWCFPLYCGEVFLLDDTGTSPFLSWRHIAFRSITGILTLQVISLPMHMENSSNFNSKKSTRKLFSWRHICVSSPKLHRLTPMVLAKNLPESAKIQHHALTLPPNYWTWMEVGHPVSLLSTPGWARQYRVHQHATKLVFDGFRVKNVSP